MTERFGLRARARAAGVHLALSALVAVLAAALVFGLWYPGAFRQLSGGRELFLLVTAVDVVLGPLLTFAVFNIAKGWPHLRRDLAVIAAIQTAALGYGLHTVYVARPVAMVFEVDRFRVVTAADVYRPDLPAAPPEYRSMPLAGPWLLSVQIPDNKDERNEALFKALGGADIGQRPKFWRPYEQGRAAALERARPISALMQRHPDRAAEFAAAIADAGATVGTATFLPVTARGDWVAVLDGSGQVATYLAVDGFF